MNPDRPHVPLAPAKAADLIDDAQRFSKELPADERDSFLRNVAWIAVGGLIAGARP